MTNKFTRYLYPQCSNVFTPSAKRLLYR